MKIKNQSLKGPREELLVIPLNGKDIVFKAKAVLDFGDFDKLMPAPKPPKAIRPGQTEAFDNIEDATYKLEVVKHQADRWNWMILESLRATPDLEWESVDPAKPETWTNYRQELLDAGFNNAEVTRIRNLVVEANGVDEDKIEEARKRFLAGHPSENDN